MRTARHLPSCGFACQEHSEHLRGAPQLRPAGTRQARDTESVVSHFDPAAASRDHKPCRPLSPDSHCTPDTASRQECIPLPTIATTPGHNGLDLCAPTFAPCLLGCPGTGRQDPVLMSLRLTGLRYSSACHSIPVTQVFKKVPLSSGLLIHVVRGSSPWRRTRDPDWPGHTAMRLLSPGPRSRHAGLDRVLEREPTRPGTEWSRA
jgi:hypothetical protein